MRRSLSLITTTITTMITKITRADLFRFARSSKVDSTTFGRLRRLLLRRRRRRSKTTTAATNLFPLNTFTCCTFLSEPPLKLAAQRPRPRRCPGKPLAWSHWPLVARRDSNFSSFCPTLKKPSPSLPLYLSLSHSVGLFVCLGCLNWS